MSLVQTLRGSTRAPRHTRSGNCALLGVPHCPTHGQQLGVCAFCPQCERCRVTHAFNTAERYRNAADGKQR